MSTSIDQAFIKQYEREVHEAYQRQMTKLRNTVRNVNNVVGYSTTFQKVGKGTAGTKTRNGEVPIMNVGHSNVECALQDYYAGDFVDKLDELKTNIDERQVLANAGAYAMGRKTDELIVNAASEVTGASIIGAGGTGMTKAKVLEAFAKLNGADVPDDGNRFAVVGPKQWNELLEINEFSDADYIGTDLPWLGASARKWLGTTWFMHTGLRLVSGARQCLWYHKTAIGHASGADVTTDITWQGTRAAHFINNMMSQGAVLIDNTGCIRIDCAE